MTRRSSSSLRRNDTKRQVSLVLAILAVIVALGAVQWLRQRSEPLPTVAELVILSGQATVTRADAGIEGPLQQGQIVTLQRGDEVETAPDARAKLTFGKEETAELAGGTQVTILDLYESAMSRSQVTILALHQGELLTRIPHVLFQGSRFLIETRIATVEAKGTVFTCGILDSQHIQVRVQEGVVDVSMGEQTLALEAGQSVYAALGQALVSRPWDPNVQATATAPVPGETQAVAQPTYTERQKTLFPVVMTPTLPGDDLEKYTVQAGDTLFSIAGRYGMPWQKIYDANRHQLSSPEALRAGQVLIIPKP